MKCQCMPRRSLAQALDDNVTSKLQNLTHLMAESIASIEARFSNMKRSGGLVRHAPFRILEGSFHFRPCEARVDLSRLFEP
jgi:hypothetical protein